jgi:hypothetical protein
MAYPSICHTFFSRQCLQTLLRLFVSVAFGECSIIPLRPRYETLITMLLSAFGQRLTTKQSIGTVNCHHVS